MRRLCWFALALTTACSVDADGDGYPAGLDCADEDPAVHPSAPEQCDTVDNDCDGLVDAGAIDAAVWFVDADEDGVGSAASAVVACDAPPGFAATGTDCDDGDPGVLPGATELCDGVDNDCDGLVDVGVTDGVVRYLDADGDAYGDPGAPVEVCGEPAGTSASADDCDDHDDSVSPGAIERCDGVDDDCDGSIDVGATDAPTWYADADGDGWGDPLAPVVVCEAPSGAVAQAGDCDDASASVHPTADERCDGLDQDCDGSVDEGAIDPSPWHADADGDGFGSVALGALACVAPPSMIADASDCDDFNADNHPGADERCDGVDNNCDALVDGPDAIDPLTWFADADGDGFGAADSAVTACDAPGLGWGFVPGDCDDAVASTSPVAPEDCGNGVDDDCSGIVDDCADVDVSGPVSAADAVKWTGPEGGMLGGSVAIVGDIDGDGSLDGVVGASATPGLDGEVNGAAWVIYGGEALVGGDVGDESELTPDEPGALGTVVAPAGDVDRDGYADFWVTAPGQASVGSAYLVWGSPSRAAAASVGSVATELYGLAYGNDVGSSAAAAGDFDGDGFDDALLADSGYNAFRGAVYVIFGGPTRVRSGAPDTHPSFTGRNEDQLGTQADSLASGDLDGDGLPDLALGGSGGDVVYLVYGDPARPVGRNALDGDAPKIRGGWSAASNVLFGEAVDITDLDDDGYGDPIAGSSNIPDGAPNAGALYVFSGGARWPVATVDVSTAWLTIYGGATTDRLAAGLASGDLDADGAADLAVGVSAWDSPFENAGMVGVLWGPPAAGTLLTTDFDARIEGEGGSDSFGSSVAVGDLDADGVSDVLVGATGFGVANEGAVYLVPSSML